MRPDVEVHRSRLLGTRGGAPARERPGGRRLGAHVAHLPARGGNRGRSALPSVVTGFRPGARSIDALALERMLGFGLGDTLDVDRLRSRLRDLGASGTYRSIWLGPQAPETRSASRSRCGAPLAAGRSRAAPMTTSWAARCGSVVWTVGWSAWRFEEARRCSSMGSMEVTGLRRSSRLVRQVLDPTLTVRLATEDVRQFDADGDGLDELETREAIGFLGVEQVLPDGWELGLGIHGHTWDEPARENVSTAGVALRASAPAGCAARWRGWGTGVASTVVRAY